MERQGRYEILEELGRGAMGRVYRARDPKIDRIVALKTITMGGLNSAEEEEYRQRFFREAQAAGKLSHSGIVTIYDIGEDELTKAPFIVMEFIEGKTLEELGRSRPLPIETALGLVGQVAEALDYAHRRQIVHRDIKPANIIVTPEGRAKITDFGIAKLAMTQLTVQGEVLGTPSYMSPEQLKGNAADGRSDLFSLGVVLYWLLTGNKPFAGDTITEVCFKIAYKDPTPPAQLNSALSTDCDYVIRRALAKDPNERYQRGQELAGDLEDLRHGHPPRSQRTAAPLPAWERTKVAQPGVGFPKPTDRENGVMPPIEQPLASSSPPRPLEPRSNRVGRAWVAVFLLLAAGVLFWRDYGHTLQLRGVRRGEVPKAKVATPTLQQVRSQPPAANDAKPSPRTSLGGDAPSKIGKRAHTASLVSRPSRQEINRPSTPTCVLQLRGHHNFERGTLYVYSDRSLLRERPLDPGTIAEDIALDAGRHTISIRIDAPDESFSQTKDTEARFEPGETRRLEIGLGFGGLGGIRKLTRKLTIRWLS